MMLELYQARPFAEVMLSNALSRGAGERSSTALLARSFELREVARVLLLDIPGVVDVRLREGTKPKLFVITSGKDLARDFVIAQRLVQVEDVKPNTFLHYDVVPRERAQLVPEDALSVR